MEFLGVGPMELMMIVLIAIIVLGPKDISKSARSVGRFLNKMYRSEAWKTLTDASRNLRTLPNRLAREAEIEELQGLRKDLDDASRGISDEVRAAERGLKEAASPIEEGLRAWTTPPPANEAPTPSNGGAPPSSPPAEQTPAPSAPPPPESSSD
jgi:sec-independent protein translocase protein TatB